MVAAAGVPAGGHVPNGGALEAMKGRLQAGAQVVVQAPPL